MLSLVLCVVHVVSTSEARWSETLQHAVQGMNTATIKVLSISTDHERQRTFYSRDAADRKPAERSASF